MIASRGAGKTTSLMHYANDLTYKYPDKMVLFVTKHPQLMVKKFLELTKELIYRKIQDLLTMDIF